MEVVNEVVEAGDAETGLAIEVEGEDDNEGDPEAGDAWEVGTEDEVAVPESVA